MKKILYIFAMLAMIGCSDADSFRENIPDEAVEMRRLEIFTRSGEKEVAALSDYVGRQQFANNDTAVFTSVKRTLRPIRQFTYKDLEFLCSVTSTASITSIGWSRIQGKGTTEETSVQTAPDRIYWSDAENAHTFIGFSKPQQGDAGKPFDWNKVTIAGQDVYYGSLGDPTMTGEGNDTIDYRSEYNSGTGAETLSGNTKLCKDDILLTYSENIKAEDAIARLKFHHGLAQVRVIVNISDFAAGEKSDTSSIVSDMKLKNMLTMYKWNQTDTTTMQLSASDNDLLSGMYPHSSTPTYNQRKDVYLWIPNPSGKGEGANKSFTFYALAVPTELSSPNSMDISFRVSYPNPMNPETLQEKIYTSSISNIKFSSGKCTTINISLNHKNEKMTVGAEYDDWDFVDSPDQGALKKNSTFLDTTNRDSITILGDAKATADDATWLYVKDGTVVDIYDNDGSIDRPYTISTARQLLSFAYEVSGTSRKSLTANAGHSNGWNFSGKYIVLDADIHLQSVINVDSLTQNKEYRKNMLDWIGIGDSSHSFDGTFLGGGRYITHLNSKAIFLNLGSNAVVSDLNLSNVVSVNSHGAIAEHNYGDIIACRVEGEVSSEAEFVGSICGVNYGNIFACIHNGVTEGSASNSKVGGLLGRNGSTGRIIASYHTGPLKGSITYGVVGQADSGSAITGCYYNKTLATPTSTVNEQQVIGKTIGEMQSRGFVNELNNVINNATDLPSDLRTYRYSFSPGAYPRVENTGI